MTDLEKLDKVHRWLGSNGYVWFEGWVQEAIDELKRLREFAEITLQGRCYACGWPLKAPDGCAPGNCSMRYKEHTPEHDRWLEKAHFMESIRNEAVTKKQPKPIDWSRMPRCRVETCQGPMFFWSVLHDGYLNCFSSMGANGDPKVQWSMNPHKVDLLPDVEWRPWLGGECPVPEGVMVDVRFRQERSDKHWETRQGIYFTWNWGNSLGYEMDIIAWRITCKADGFTT